MGTPPSRFCRGDLKNPLSCGGRFCFASLSQPFSTLPIHLPALEATSTSLAAMNPDFNRETMAAPSAAAAQATRSPRAASTERPMGLRNRTKSSRETIIAGLQSCWAKKGALDPMDTEKDEDYTCWDSAGVGYLSIRPYPDHRKVAVRADSVRSPKSLTATGQCSTFHRDLHGLLEIHPGKVQSAQVQFEATILRQFKMLFSRCNEYRMSTNSASEVTKVSKRRVV